MEVTSLSADIAERKVTPPADPTRKARFLKAAGPSLDPS